MSAKKHMPTCRECGSRLTAAEIIHYEETCNKCESKTSYEVEAPERCDNGDQSAVPIVEMKSRHSLFDDFSCTSLGLTKREAFAMAALQGLLAGGKLSGAGELAVHQADVLLKELEK